MIFRSCKKLNYDIKIYYNIFSNKERKIILDQFKMFLTKIPNYPGLQTTSYLHELCENNDFFFNPYDKIKKISKINRKIKKSWVNYTDTQLSYENWHVHGNDQYTYSCCYMIENPENFGTWFNVDNEIYKTHCPTNSLIVFPNSLLHTVPPNVKKPRYSLTIDFE